MEEGEAARAGKGCNLLPSVISEIAYTSSRESLTNLLFLERGGAGN